jgi:putative CocE/NonD family hydrolase
MKRFGDGWRSRHSRSSPCRDPIRRSDLFNTAARGGDRGHGAGQTDSLRGEFGARHRFTAKLIDVAPNGYAANLCEGIVRARYRDSARRGTLIEPGRPYQFTIDLVATRNLFQRGHRIRLEVSSSNFPRFDRNLNTGAPVAVSSEPRIARQTVYHDSGLSSHLQLPIINDR